MNNNYGTVTSALGRYYGKYEYILTDDQLIRAFNDSRNNLNYALLKESNRQRFLIANSQGLKTKFFDSIKKDFANSTADIEKAIATDIYNYTMALFHGGAYNPSTANMNIGDVLGRAIGNTIVATAEAIWKNEDRGYR